ncbi:MAG: hypothetical protein HC890_16820, partial [Chloroflexaceae bacterium]|nr:hypothetical protein [Chloroflexaceae bacterium]
VFSAKDCSFLGVQPDYPTIEQAIANSTAERMKQKDRQRTATLDSNKFAMACFLFALPKSEIGATSCQQLVPLKLNSPGDRQWKSLAT